MHIYDLPHHQIVIQMFNIASPLLQSFDTYAVVELMLSQLNIHLLSLQQKMSL